MKKTDRHYSICDRDGHIESKCFNNIEALEVAMKKHNIHLDTYLTSSWGQSLSASVYVPSRSGYALNVSLSSPYHEWLIDFGTSYHMAKHKSMFLALNDCNTKNIYVGVDISLRVVVSRTIHLDNG